MAEGLKLNAPFHLNACSHMTVMGSSNEEENGYHEYQHTYTYTMSSKQKERSDISGHIEEAAQFNPDNSEEIKRIYRYLTISFPGHMSHSVTPHNKDEEEKDMDDFDITIIGEMNINDFSNE